MSQFFLPFSIQSQWGLKQTFKKILFGFCWKNVGLEWHKYILIFWGWTIPLKYSFLLWPCGLLIVIYLLSPILCILIFLILCCGLAGTFFFQGEIIQVSGTPGNLYIVNEEKDMSSFFHFNYLFIFTLMKKKTFHFGLGNILENG